MTAGPTLHTLSGQDPAPNPLSQSALILIDCQNTYREGVMRLDGVEPALEQAQALLDRARRLGTPIIHIQHDAGQGSPYDITTEIGAIADPVAPQGSEPVVVKNYPSSFEKTDLDERLKALGVEKLVLAGFMTHMCVNSTARAAFNNGYGVTVVAGATATRALPNPLGGDVSSADVHASALAAIGDLFGVVVRSEGDVPD
ncbi:MAG: cysteine hydrolase family protein [Pseudomonadota bacterium]